MTRVFAVVAIAIVATFGTTLFVGTASADVEPSCWGRVSAALGQDGDMGTHASDQAEPRDGLPNLARELLGDDVDEPIIAALGALLNTDPEIEECDDA